MHIKQKLAKTKNFVKTHPKEITYFAAGVATTVVALKIRDRNKAILVTSLKDYKRIAEAGGAGHFKSKHGNTVLISDRYLNR